jgi:hypothetical protein
LSGCCGKEKNPDPVRFEVSMAVTMMIIISQKMIIINPGPVWNITPAVQPVACHCTDFVCYSIKIFESLNFYIEVRLCVNEKGTVVES